MDGLCAKDIHELALDLSRGEIDSLALCDAFADRIERVDRQGAELKAVAELNPAYREDAKALDVERASGKIRGPLHGIPLLIKDNIDTAGPLRTTAGSLALDGKPAPRDAEIVRRLREAGAVILGKTNLSEWANFRSPRSTSGWSARSGQTRNPHVLDRSPGGSSSGSAAAVAAFLCPVAIGTETDGSIINPASVCGVAGMKPTLGLIPRTGIVPIALSQDTAGPIARSCRSLAIVLDALAGSDASDPATLLPAISDRYGKEYGASAKGGAYSAGGYESFLAGDPGLFISGKRFGVVRSFTGFDAPTDALFEESLVKLRALGAVLVDPVKIKVKDRLERLEYRVLLYEFKRDLEAYLENRPDVPARSLSSLIQWNEDNAKKEMAHFGQEIFEESMKAHKRGPGPYWRALRAAIKIAQRTLLEVAFTPKRLDFLLWPSNGPASVIDHVVGDRSLGGHTSLPAISGWPSLTVPMGFTRGALPAGITVCARPFHDAALLAAGAGVEMALSAIRDPGFLPTLA